VETKPELNLSGINLDDVNCSFGSNCPCAKLRGKAYSKVIIKENTGASVEKRIKLATLLLEPQGSLVMEVSANVETREILKRFRTVITDHSFKPHFKCITANKPIQTR